MVRKRGNKRLSFPIAYASRRDDASNKINILSIYDIIILIVLASEEESETSKK